MDKGRVSSSFDTRVPLLALSVEAQTLLSTLLNPLKVLPSEDNMPRDWRGIAELCMVPIEKLGLFEGKPDPFKEVMTYLSADRVNGAKITMDDLKAFLMMVDRVDVLEDVADLLDRDALTYKKRMTEVDLSSVGTQIPLNDLEVNMLTFEDAARAQRRLPLCRYDAFILYSEDDSSFASEVILRMEKEYKLKLCSKDRDLLPGLRFEHEIIGKMIELRCNRLLVIFSPSFLQSPANQFLVSYAQAVALDTRSRKIIPCVYKKCELPPSVRYSFCIDFNRSGKLWNFWDKLGQSLAVPTSDRCQITPSSPTPTASSLSTKLDGNVNITKDDMEWWDANKLEAGLDDVRLNGNQDIEDGKQLSKGKGEQEEEQVVAMVDGEDSLSVNSRQQLLSSSTPVSGNSSSKSGKWFSKIMSPMSRKKRSEGKQKPIAE